MTIRDIVGDARGRAGSGGSWRVERHTEMLSGQRVEVAELWHYAHRMLVWNVEGRRPARARRLKENQSFPFQALSRRAAVPRGRR